MAPDRKRDKPSTRALLTGAAQPMTNGVERAHEHFKHHLEPSQPPSKERPNFRTRKPEAKSAEELAGEPQADSPDAQDEPGPRDEEGEDET